MDGQLPEGTTQYPATIVKQGTKKIKKKNGF